LLGVRAAKERLQFLNRLRNLTRTTLINSSDRTPGNWFRAGKSSSFAILYLDSQIKRWFKLTFLYAESYNDVILIHIIPF